MPETFEERDFRGAEFRGVDMTGARFRGANFTGVKITDAFFVDVDIDALIGTVIINGVDVTQYVNDELRRRDPLRGQLRPVDPDGARTTWTALEARWAATMERARRLSDVARNASVDGEWSFLQTLRHLVFAMDKWFTNPVLGMPLAPIGLPNSGAPYSAFPGLDPDAEPTFEEVAAVRAERVGLLRTYLATMTVADFTNAVAVPHTGNPPVQACLGVVFTEEYAHNSYAERDLAQLGA